MQFDRHRQLINVSITLCSSQRKEVRLLICTDVAARGIDIHGVPYGGDSRQLFLQTNTTCTLSDIASHNVSVLLSVINVTLPDEKQNYVHRIGRVGRAERLALAVLLRISKYGLCVGAWRKGRNYYQTV